VEEAAPACVRACSGFTWRASDCEELVGVTYKRYGIVVSYAAC